MRRHWCLISLSTLSLIYALTAAQEPVATASPEKIREAMDRSIKYLVKLKGQETNWELSTRVTTGSYKGGVTALVCLALLESGVKPSDASIKDSLRYLRKVNMTKTYCQGLRMAVLAHILRNYPTLADGGDKSLLAQDRRQLMQYALREKSGQLKGWSYPHPSPDRPDFSNTDFAILGLEAAHEAGLETSREDWQAVRDLLLRTENKAGGWNYLVGDGTRDRTSMTLAGIAGLSASCKYLKEAPPQKSIDQAFKLVGQKLNPDKLLEHKTGNHFPYYTLFAMSRASALTQVKQLTTSAGKTYFVYDVLAAALLKSQAADGSWGGPEPNLLDGSDVLATSFALIYLARGQAK